ncbi:hypothetical protein M9H77_05264 [Catharanthus roseus]|uniref:Uncharacterized protein n=1 Tax=Catharanthus roseus TaxID=4058 RepID=A0ACC0CGE8_CATRO|nr:hypothetical protein M9H77_05264 [Catharanthus roseus]
MGKGRRLSLVWSLVKLLMIISVVVLGINGAELPAVFIFGDSTADVGTNNHLQGCLATANNRFYGIDYPFSKPTGRFSNGYNTADEVVRLLGDFRESPQPYLYLITHMSSFKSKIVGGVNFASGGAGLFDDTGKANFKNVVPLGQQIQQFAAVQGNITELLGSPKAENHLANSLYLISVGSNDIFDNANHTNPIILLSNLTNSYANHLKNLYDLGARKFGIVSVPNIGCIPAIRYLFGGNCSEGLNSLARAFYTSVQGLMQNFSSSYNGVHYSLGNAFQMTQNILDNPRANGFKNVIDACCGDGKFNGKNKCTPKSNLCLKRNEFLFWDWFHPTQKASKLAAETLVFAEGAEYVTPMNFSTLAATVIN